MILSYNIKDRNLIHPYYCDFDPKDSHLLGQIFPVKLQNRDFKLKSY